jgi:hypothetical protein
MNVITVRRPVKRGSIPTSRTVRSFRDLARSHFEREKSWQFAIEALLFAILTAISVWPILMAAGALHEFLQRTAS